MGVFISFVTSFDDSNLEAVLGLSSGIQIVIICRFIIMDSTSRFLSVNKLDTITINTELKLLIKISDYFIILAVYSP